MTPRSCAHGFDGVGVTSRFAVADLELLAEAGRRLCGPLDLSSVLGRATAFIVPALADWCVLALRQADGHVRAVAFAHSDAACRDELARLVARTDFDEPRQTAMARASDGMLAWVPAFDAANRGATPPVCAWSPAEFAGLGTGSVICAPLAHANVPVGAVLVVRKERDGYPPQTVEIVAEIARRIGVVIGNAIRFETLQAELQQLNEAFALAAHELRTPAAALKGGAQLLVRQFAREQVVSPGELMDGLSRINWQAARLGSMIDRLMDSAVAANGKLSVVPQAIDLRELVANVLALTNASEPERTVKVDAPKSVRAEVDPLRMEQVLLNLLDNAFKFSPKETVVEVSIREPRPGRVVLAIRDHGIGVPVDQRTHIFDRFVQAHREQSPVGLGLGLYLSQQIVEQHGGTLSAQYPEDGGARFILELPALETVPSAMVISDNGYGGPAHDPARTQTDRSPRSHTGRPASHICTTRVNRVASVSGCVAAGVSP